MIKLSFAELFKIEAMIQQAKGRRVTKVCRGTFRLKVVAEKVA